ncbi:MAG: NifB/NifX family molybdenum-iron cluster-binding protein [Nautiliaceae bacterium]
MKVVFPTNDKKNIAPKIGLAKGFLIIDTNSQEEIYLENERLNEIITSHGKLKGDCGEHGLGIGQVIPKKLKELGVEIFVAKFFGEGMLGNLDLYGIKTYITDKKHIKKVLEEIKEKNGN